MIVRDLVVVGGGVAGLIIAHDAARAGLSVDLFEADESTGGLLRSAVLRGPSRGEVVVDVGAESFATRTSGVTDLIEDAGLELSIVAPAPAGAHLAFTSDGAVSQARLPRRTVLGIPADPGADDVVRIIGAAAARRAAAERDLPPWTDAQPEPSLADLVTGRCGGELVRGLVDPLCRSVYSQPASAVRLSRLHPALWRAFVERGSLLEAVRAVADSQGAHRAGSAVAGIAGGMWRLAAAMRAAAESHGAVIRTGAPVTALTVDAAAGVRVSRGADEAVVARRVVVATGSAAARRLLTADGEPAAPAPAPVRVIAALVHAPALDAHPVGSGVIVAADVPTAAKALTHVTAKWTWTAEAMGARGDHVVRLSARDASAPGLDTPAEIADEIAVLTGIPRADIEIIDLVDRLWPDAVAAAPVTEAGRAAWERAGVHLAGAAVAGTGLASVVPHARALAGRLISETPASTLNASQGSTHV